MGGEHQVGGLNERVQLQQLQDDGTLMPVATFWARVSPSGGPRWAPGDVTHTVVIRFRNNLKVGDRFVWRGRSLEIIERPQDISGRRKFTASRCAEAAK